MEDVWPRGATLNLARLPKGQMWEEPERITREDVPVANPRRTAADDQRKSASVESPAVRQLLSGPQGPRASPPLPTASERRRTIRLKPLSNSNSFSPDERRGSCLSQETLPFSLFLLILLFLEPSKDGAWVNIFSHLSRAGTSLCSIDSTSHTKGKDASPSEAPPLCPQSGLAPPPTTSRANDRLLVSFQFRRL